MIVRKSIIAILLILVCLTSCVMSRKTAEDANTTEQTMLENLCIVVDGARPMVVRTIHHEYRNNRYISLRDLAAALDGTARQFDVSISEGSV